MKTDDEFLSQFHMERSCVMQLNRLVGDDQEFRSVSGKMGKKSSMLFHIVSDGASLQEGPQCQP